MDIFTAAMSSPVFFGLPPAEAKKIVNCTHARFCTYRRNTRIVCGDDDAKRIGILLTGSAFIAREDKNGNRCILSGIEKDDVFGLSMLLSETPEDLFIYAGECCTALLFGAEELLFGCDNGCFAHRQMLFNFITLLSRKNLNLVKKLQYVSKRSLRAKIISFLCDTRDAAGQDTFTIPYNRQGMADYLAADRSALSAELSRMRREGLIEFQKNRFTLTEKLKEQEGETALCYADKLP